MTDTQKLLKDLADAVSAVIVAIGELWLATRNIEPSTPSNVPNQTPTPQPVVHETPVPAVEEKGRISSRQLAMLRKLCNEKLDGDWNAFDASCKQRLGKAVTYLTTKEASGLISELLGGGESHGYQSRSAR